MSQHDTAESNGRQRLLPETSGPMLKAGIRKTDVTVTRQQIGQALDRCRTLCQLSLKEFARVLERDERQVARWIAGIERPQLDAIFADSRLHLAFVQALAELANAEVVTTITIRRSA